MSFGNYTSIDSVAAKYHIRCLPGRVVSLAADAPSLGDYFRQELAFNLDHFPLNRSEASAGEFVLMPLLREVWKPYREDLSLFSHEPLEFDDDLCGIPDYFVCRRSEFGPFFPTPPFLLVVEAKLDDFEKAWGQCLAAMLAAQKLNAAPEFPIHGIATNGKTWEFGVLLGREFTQQQEPFTLFGLDILSQALHAVLQKAQATARALTPAATP
jgi:hypothetical protein